MHFARPSRVLKREAKKSTLCREVYILNASQLLIRVVYEPEEANASTSRSEQDNGIHCLCI